MMKHQFAEILIEREYDAVLIKRRTCSSGAAIRVSAA